MQVFKPDANINKNELKKKKKMRGVVY